MDFSGNNIITQHKKDEKKNFKDKMTLSKHTFINKT